VEGAYGHCWVRDHDSVSAALKARYKICQYNWEIIGVEQEMIAVDRANFYGKDLGEQHYNTALEKGMSISYVAWAGEKQPISTPVLEKLEHADSVDLAQHLVEHQERQQRGECLHFEMPTGCDDFINAHSIPKRVALSAIAENGMVYVPSLNLNDLTRRGMFSFVKKGIATFSTFRGFCKKHDNKFFTPIDNQIFTATDEQIALLAYRALSRELFLKKRSVEGFWKNAEHHKGTEATRILLTEAAAESEIGLQNLRFQKDLYDQSCASGQFSDFRAAVFISNSQPNLVFSSALFPDYGFGGEPLQRFGTKNAFDLITFSFVPMENNWAFVFAWHKKSSPTCTRLLNTLASAARNGTKIEDALFKFVVFRSENIAFSPRWWDSKSAAVKEAITQGANYCGDLLSIPLPILPEVSLNGVSDWSFGSVISKYSDKE
jgi:hypothetical protein